MNNWMNLYTFLIDNVSDGYVFGDKVKTDIKYGIIKVNGMKPDDVNMRLNLGDIITVDRVDYKVAKMI